MRNSKSAIFGWLILGAAAFQLVAAASAQAFRVRLVKFLFEIKGGPGAPFNQPTDVALSRDGRIYVLDGVYDRVQVFDKQGNFQFKFGSTGSGDGEFNRPLGLNVDRQGNVYVADSRNHRLQVFDGSGKYLYQIVLPQKGVSKPPDPAGVLVVSPRDEDEVIWVTDKFNHRVLIYDKESRKLQHQFGGLGFEDDEGRFRYPFSIATDSKSNVYIVDVVNTRVQMFDKKAKFINKIGGWGVREGTFFRPNGVACDSDNNIYVSDCYMGVIQVFKTDGSYLGVVAEEKDKEKKFHAPVRLYIDQHSRLFVVEEAPGKEGKVSVYSLL